MRPQFSAREKKLPSSPSSSPALIPQRIQSTAVWDRSNSLTDSSSQVLQSGESRLLLLLVVVVTEVVVGKMRAGSTGREKEVGGILLRCVNVWRPRAQPCSHSLRVTFWSGPPALTVRSALPLTSHLKGEGLISRWWH